MRAIVVFDKGKFRLMDVDVPRISQGEVLLRIRYAALCYRDLLQLKGYYPRMRYPVILGHEAVGVVEESMDPRFSKGDVVVPMVYDVDGVCDMCVLGDDVHCRNRRSFGEDVNGFFAEYARANSASLVKVPSWVSEKLAVLTPCVLAMVYRGFVKAGLNRGDYVLVTGSGGGVGIHAVQLAKAMGARVIAVTSSDVKAKVVGRYADKVIVGGSFSEEVKRIVGDGVDVVVEAVGTPTLEESMRSLRQGGRLILIGNVNPDEHYKLRLGYVILKDISIIGNVAAGKKDIVSVFRIAKDAEITPVVTGEYRLEEFDEALRMLESRDRVGKILLRP